MTDHMRPDVYMCESVHCLEVSVPMFTVCVFTNLSSQMPPAPAQPYRAVVAD